MSNIGYALRMAKKYYTDTGYNHAIRVMQYIAENDMIPDDKKDDCISLAIMHDLWEDTKYPKGCGLDEEFAKCLELLTKKKDADYIDYVKEIKKYSDTHPMAYWVKIADMKDHLTQSETLTDKLKEKYLKALPHLL